MVELRTGFPIVATLVLALAVNATHADAQQAVSTAVPKNRPTAGIEFIQIKPGTFMMGWCGEPCNAPLQPPHKVTITKEFEIGQYELTQAQWQATMGSNPSHFQGENLPIENVSWNDAQQFLTKLNGMNDGYRYRLPTEAEWEYACSAGGRRSRPLVH